MDDKSGIVLLHGFTPIHSSLETVRSTPRGPHRSEWSCGKAFLHNCMYLFSVIHVLGKLICCPGEFDYLKLVVSVWVNEHKKTWHLGVLHVLSKRFASLSVFVNSFELCRK